MLRQSGSVRRDSEEERAFMALSISMTTRMLRDIVEAERAEEFEKMAQSMEGMKVLQRWKCVWGDSYVSDHSL